MKTEFHKILSVALLSLMAAQGAAQGSAQAQETRTASLTPAGDNGQMAVAVEAPESLVFAPRLAQKGGFRATVYLDHSACGADCWGYSLSKEIDRVTLAAKISFSCPAGSRVERLSYRLGNGIERKVYTGGGESRRRISRNILIAPWLDSELVEAAGKALGGSWRGSEAGQNNNPQTARLPLTQKVTVEARCSGDDTLYSAEYRLDSLISVVDTAWSLPSS